MNTMTVLFYKALSIRSSADPGIVAPVGVGSDSSEEGAVMLSGVWVLIISIARGVMSCSETTGTDSEPPIPPDPEDSSKGGTVGVLVPSLFTEVKRMYSGSPSS